MENNKKRRTKKPTRLIISIIGAVVLLAIGIPGIAYSGSGFYLGYGFTKVDIGGDMDGTTFVGGGGSAEVLPDQDTGSGGKWIIGGVLGNGAMEVSTTQSNHDGVWVGVPY